MQVRKAARKCLVPLEKRLEEEHAARLQPGETSGEQKIENTRKSAGTRAVNKKVSEQLEKLEEEKRKHSNPGMRLGFLLASWLCIVPYTFCMAGASWISGSQEQPRLGGFRSNFHPTAPLHPVPAPVGGGQKTGCNGRRARRGTLSEALEWPDASTQRVAASALTRLLPLMTASDGNLLNAKQRSCLYNILRKRNVRSQEPLITAILTALQQVGDHAAIPAVERLIDLPAIKPPHQSTQSCQPNPRVLGRNCETAKRQFHTVARVSCRRHALRTSPARFHVRCGRRRPPTASPRQRIGREIVLNHDFA